MRPRQRDNELSGDRSQLMFGMSGTELAIVLILALLLLGPSKLPELARTMGKAIREFKRATNDLRSTVETEFYRMDQPERPAQTLQGAAKPPETASTAPAEAVPVATASASASAEANGATTPKTDPPNAKS